MCRLLIAISMLRKRIGPRWVRKGGREGSLLAALLSNFHPLGTEGSDSKAKVPPTKKSSEKNAFQCMMISGIIEKHKLRKISRSQHTPT